MAEIADLPAHLWREDLRTGLAKRLESPDKQGSFDLRSVLRDLGRVLPDRAVPSQELSASPHIPRVREIPISLQLSQKHPLSGYILQKSPLTSFHYRQLLSSPHIDLSITGFHTGSVPAAVHSRFFNGEELSATDYARNEWMRDSILVSVACHRAGLTNLSYSILRNVWHFLGSHEQRASIIDFHKLPDEEAQARYERGEGRPQIKWKIGPDGKLAVRDHVWGDDQHDALGAGIWAPFRFANQRHVGMSAYAARNYVGEPLSLHSLDPVYGTGENILVAYIKFLNRIDVAYRSDLGPWEDRKTKSRASSVGIINSAMKEAMQFHDREGWDILGAQYSEGQRPEWYQAEVRRVYNRTSEVLKRRIPDNGFATEADERPIDSAVLLLNYPFRGALSEKQENSTLAVGYRNLRPEGILRWENDEKLGPDAYVGQDYIYNRDPVAKGEFADNSVQGYRAPRWTMFDPLIAARSFIRFIESDGEDFESFLRADRHMKRSLSQITQREHDLHIEGKNEHFVVPKGVLPEAYFWDSREKMFRPCHNSPLLMAQSLFALAFERAVEATQLLESKYRVKVAV